MADKFNNIRQEDRYRGDTPPLFAAKLVLPDLSEARKVLVVDISRNGAKLHVGYWPELNRDVYLMLPGPGGRDTLRLICDKRWQVGDKIGVRFEAPISDATLMRLAGSAAPLSTEGADARDTSRTQVVSDEMKVAIGEQED